MSLADVGHVSSPPAAESPQPALPVAAQLPEIPEAIRKREFKPLGSYVLHHNRIALNFEAEKTRLKKDIPQAYALLARLEWLKAVVDFALKEQKPKTPEIEAEWIAIRAAKLKLQDSKSKSIMHVIAADAKHVLPIWQASIEEPVWIRSSYDRVQQLFSVQSLINASGATRLAEFQALRAQEQILQEQRKEIRKLEKEIQAKLVQLPIATHQPKEFTCLKMPCRIEQERYPQGNTSFETVAKYYRSAETTWKETLETLDKLRAHMQEKPEHLLLEALHGYQTSLGQYELVLKGELKNCRQQYELFLSKKADYLATLGKATPEVKQWLESAQAELEERITLLLFELKSRKDILQQFAKRLKDHAAAHPDAAPNPVSVKPSRSAVKKVIGFDLSKHRDSPAPQEKPAEIEWLRMKKVAVYNCVATLMPDQDRVKMVMPPEEDRRDLTQIDTAKWTLVDRWCHSLHVILPQVTQLLQDLMDINRSVFRLQQQNALLAQIFKGSNLKKEPSVEFVRQRPWLLSLLAEMREAANKLSQRRDTIRANYQKNVLPLHGFISEMENNIAVGKEVTTSKEMIDQQAQKLQGLMAAALNLLRLAEGVAVSEWSLGDILNKVMSGLEEYPVSDKRVIAKPDIEQALETKPAIDLAFSKILALEDEQKRMVALKALEAEGAAKERNKLDWLQSTFFDESERLDSLVNHLLAIGANWAHLNNMADGIKNSRVTAEALSSPLEDLMKGWDAMKNVIAEYRPFIPEVLKKLRTKILWLEEKLTPQKKRWREDQEGFLMRTAEGNQERIQQLEQEIGKYQLAIASVEAFWKAGEEKCRLFAATLNELNAKNLGVKTTLVNENPYQAEVKAEAAPAPAAAPASMEDKEPVAPHLEWTIVSDDRDLKKRDGDLVNLSGFDVFAKPPAAPAPAAAEAVAVPKSQLGQSAAPAIAKPAEAAAIPKPAEVAVASERAAAAPAPEPAASIDHLHLSGIEQMAEQLGTLAVLSKLNASEVSPQTLKLTTDEDQA